MERSVHFPRGSFGTICTWKWVLLGWKGKTCGIYSVASQHFSENQGWKWRNSWWPEIITIAHFIYGLIAYKVLSDTLSHYILTKSLGGKGNNHLVPFHRWGSWDTKRLVLSQGQLRFISGEVQVWMFQKHFTARQVTKSRVSHPSSTHAPVKAQIRGLHSSFQKPTSSNKSDYQTHYFFKFYACSLP